MTGTSLGAIIVIFLVLAVPLIIGFASRKQALPTSEDYFIQGRAMGGVFVFATVVTTWWSAFAFLGSNAWFFNRGPLYWTSLGWNIFFGVMYYIIGKRIWYFGKINKYMTAKDFFAHHYDSRWLANLIAFAMILFTLPNLQIQLTGGALLIETASGGIIPFWMAGLLFYAVIITYVWAGGVRAIAWTDILHGIMLFFGMTIGGLFIVSILGGHANMFQMLAEVKPQNLQLHPNDWMMWVAMFFVTPIGVLMGPHMWTRMFAVKSSKIFNLMPFLIGFVAIAYFGSMLTGNSGVILAPDIGRPDTLFPVLLLEYAPYVFAVLLISCGATAAMSTANSQVHSMASIYALDFHKVYFNKNLNDNQVVWVGRYAILVFSAGAYLMNLFATDLLVTIGLFSLSGLAQVIVPTLGAFFWKRSTKEGATVGTLLGLLLVIAFQYKWVPLPGPFKTGGGGLLGLICNAAAFIIVSLLTKPRSQKLIDSINEQYKGYYSEEND